MWPTAGQALECRIAFGPSRRSKQLGQRRGPRTTPPTRAMGSACSGVPLGRHAPRRLGGGPHEALDPPEHTPHGTRRKTRGADAQPGDRTHVLSAPLMICRAWNTSTENPPRGLSKAALELSNAVLEAGIFGLLPRTHALLVLGLSCSGAGRFDRGASACHLACSLALDKALVPVVHRPLLHHHPSALRQQSRQRRLACCFLAWRYMAGPRKPGKARQAGHSGQGAGRGWQARGGRLPQGNHTRSPPPLLCRVVPVPLLLLVSLWPSTCHSLPRLCGKTVSPWHTMSSPCSCPYQAPSIATAPHSASQRLTAPHSASQRLCLPPCLLPPTLATAQLSLASCISRSPPRLSSTGTGRARRRQGRKGREAR
jgi:hypothetical protein